MSSFVRVWRNTDDDDHHAAAIFPPGPEGRQEEDDDGDGDSSDGKTKFIVPPVIFGQDDHKLDRKAQEEQEIEFKESDVDLKKRPKFHVRNERSSTNRFYYIYVKKRANF